MSSTSTHNQADYAVKPVHDFNVIKVTPDNITDDTAPVTNEQTYAFSDSRKLGVTGAVFLIINKMIGTGIFSTPSSIFQVTGSVGIALVLWIIGGVLTFIGLAVFLEFGLAIPRSGGEKNYLERAYPRPRLLATCMLMAQMLLLGFSSGNALAFGRYCIFASGSTVADGWQARGIGIVCITFCVVLHSTLPKWGIRLLNVLGVFKVIILVFIIFAGFAALAGHRQIPDPHNFDNVFLQEATANYGGSGAYEYCSAILNIVYSYKGFENAFYVVSELKEPRKTLRVAAPLAAAGVTVLYVLVNVAYFAAIDKTELATSEVLVAGVFFRNIFGASAGARALPAFVALSNIGNVLAVSFAHARLNQEFAKEGLLPYSKFWASIEPFGAPAPALFLHWFITVIVLVAPPAGPSYNFITNLYTFGGAAINVFVSFGLLKLRLSKNSGWSSPFKTWLPVIVVYFLLNIFLVSAPFVPPTGSWTAAGYPYYIFPVVGFAVLAIGVVYWTLYTRVVPKLLGYKIVAERFISEVDGAETVRYRKVKIANKSL